MNAYEVRVVTKLGSVYRNSIVASDEEEAIRKAKAKYPLFKDVYLEGERDVAPSETSEKPRSKLFPQHEGMNLARIQRNNYADGKSLMIRGAVIGLGGVLTTVIAFISGWIVVWFVLAAGYGLIDFLRGYSLWKNNRPLVGEAPGFDTLTK